MGLDVSAYRQVLKVDCVGPNEYECGHAYLCPNEDFPGQADGMQPGCYVFAQRSRYEQEVSRSYTGYGLWLEWLAETVLGFSANAIWKDPERFVGSPFFELINFSDCEGIIGPVTSAKLAMDFVSHREWVEAADQEARTTYEKFAQLFAIAADSGAVQFH